MVNNPIRIVKIWKNDYPWDVRVEKITKALTDAGHIVHLVCRNVNRLCINEKVNGVHIHRFLPIKPNLLNILYSVPFFLNPFWFYKIFRILHDCKANVIIVRDLPLVISAIFVGKILKVPVIFDMAENYPAMWQELSGFTNRLTKNPTVARLIEDFAIKRVDHIITVVEESKNRLIEKGVSSENISIVSNTPDLRDFLHRSMDELNISCDKFTLLYIGYINKFRGLDIVIRALSKIRLKIPEIYFVVVGDGKFIHYLKKLAQEMDVTENICFVGWVSFEKIPSYIRISDVCVVPHYATEHKNTTVPNKLFDYMAFRKPVIVSDATPLKRIVNEVGCGLVFQSGKDDSFIDVTCKLWKNSLARKTMGEKGFRAIEEKYNWGHDSTSLIHTIEAVASNH